MSHLLTGAALLLHTAWWGVGLALLLMPRPWRRFWPVFVPVCGFGLQTAAVWAGVMLDLPGTRSYAGWSELLPGLLLLLGLRRHGWRMGALAHDVARTSGLWAAVAGVLFLLIQPMTEARRELTTLSLGSCDAADYAAGARLMEEFRRSDRSGFLGLTEVVELHSVDNFFDHFVRLNHFAPSALVAHHAALLQRRPHEVISLLTAVFLAAGLPLVYWLARATLRFRPVVAWTATLIYGLGPVTWYAVAHVAMGQLIATQAVTLLTIGGVALWRCRATRQAAVSWFGLLAVAYGLIFSAYHFIIVIALVPATAFVLIRAWLDRSWSRLGRWDLAVMLPGLAAGAFYGERVLGLIERFLLFQQHDFGWPIRGLTPEGWLGLVAAPDFTPMDPVWRVALVLLLGGLLLATFVHRAGRRWFASAFAMTIPVLVGYAYLLARGAWLGTNASYDAYKLFSVFYPGVLAVSVVWMHGLSGGWRSRLVAGAMAVVVLAGNVASVRTFSQRIADAPLAVDPELADLQRIESLPEVDSINLRLPDMWSRLWANAFLLRRAQYFETHTYEGRRNTELKGHWDLVCGESLLQVRRVRPDAGTARLSPPYQLRRVGEVAEWTVEWGRGWYGLEHTPEEGGWRWAEPGAVLVVGAARDERPRTLEVQLTARSVVPRELQLRQEGRILASVQLGAKRERVTFGPMTLPAGRVELRLDSPTPAVSFGEDPRALLVCVYGFVFNEWIADAKCCDQAAAGASVEGNWECKCVHRRAADAVTDPLQLLEPVAPGSR